MNIISKISRIAIVLLLLGTALLPNVNAKGLSCLLAPEAKWRKSLATGKLEVKSLAKCMGENPGIEVLGSKTKKKTTFASLVYKFKKRQNWAGVKSFSFWAKADKKVYIKVSISCKGGTLYSGFVKKNNRSAFINFDFPLDKLKKKGSPDLTQVKSITIGMGIWGLDTTKDPFSLKLSKFEAADSSECFIIPKPSEGVSIDGLFRDDWGYEDNLYNWTPPVYLFLNDRSQVVAGGPVWKGIQQLSGRFSFMMDEENLYFLGLVVDDTPFKGKEHSSLWENDSIELFLATKVTSKHLQFEEAMSKANGVQVIFDCGENHNKAMTLVKRKQVHDSGVKYKINPKSWLQNGKQVKGYILEAAIPLKLFPDFKKKRGMLLGYSIKLNDSTGGSLIITPDNYKPVRNIKNFKKAYVEIALKEGATKIKFEAPAKDVFWPAKYTKGAGRIKIWDMAKASRKKVSATTDRLYLNSLWAVQAVADSSNSPKAGDWYYMPLPLGIGWYTPVFKIDSKKGDTLAPREVGYGKLGGKSKPFFWYERLFRPDPSFKGKNITFNVDYVVKEVNVYLNKEFIGTISPLNPSIDVTNKLKFDRENRVDFLLYTNVIPGISVRNGISGVVGDIYLEANEYKPAVKDLWVKKASGINGDFDMVVETSPSDEELKLKIQILDKAGKVLSNTTKDVSPGKKITVSSLTVQCSKFKPWSPEKPNLFFARLQVYKKDKLVQETKKRFGFRTLEVKNGHCLLNGKILRIRVGFAANPSRVAEPGRFEKLRKYGHNAVFMHASTSGHNGPIFDKLDEEGFFAFAPTSKSWDNKMTVQEIRRYRSHPSVLGYVSDSFGQLDVNGYIHNPFSVSDTYYPDSKKAVKLYEFLRRRNDLFKSVDPTRPYIPQGTGNFEGAFRNIHHYPCYDVNMLDRMMYFHPWSKRSNPIYPLHLYEGTMVSLVSVDSCHPEHKFPVENGRIIKRMLLYEDASRYIGQKAFDGWMEWDRLIAQNTVRGFRTCGLDGFTPWISDDIFLLPINNKKPMDIKDNRKLSYKYFMQPFDSKNFENMWMRMGSWYYRLRGMARWQWPEEYGQGKLTEIPTIFTSLYENEMQPLFAYIAGHKGEVFSLAHGYYAGEKINKQIVVANDTEDNFTSSFYVYEVFRKAD
ncbi:MAG: hypothetical protein GY750_15440 [Lentisphaerae bacterium]|nr:hypothetical protein [Lentisphaerota bacterium]MCP4102792.1 hypothetical protein [Lentisphaerota bacterium]